MMDFDEAKQKKERGMTVKDVIEVSLKDYKDIESIVISSKYKDGTIQTGFSWESSLESLGMLEVSKTDIIGYMET